MDEVLSKYLNGSLVIKRGDYNYFINPLADGIPQVDPAILRHCALMIMMHTDMQKVDYIVTIEAAGIPIATTLSVLSGKPLTIIRKKVYGLNGEVMVKQKTGYSESNLFINGVAPGDRVLVVDDVLSTGGTLKAVMSGLKTMNARVVDVFVTIEKDQFGGREILNEMGVDVKALATISVTAEHVKTLKTLDVIKGACVTKACN